MPNEAHKTCLRDLEVGDTVAYLLDKDSKSPQVVKQLVSQVTPQRVHVGDRFYDRDTGKCISRYGRLTAISRPTVDDWHRWENEEKQKVEQRAEAKRLRKEAEQAFPDWVFNTLTMLDVETIPANRRRLRDAVMNLHGRECESEVILTKFDVLDGTDSDTIPDEEDE